MLMYMNQQQFKTQNMLVDNVKVNRKAVKLFLHCIGRGRNLKLDKTDLINTDTAPCAYYHKMS